MNLTLGAITVDLDDHALDRLADLVAARLEHAPTPTSEWVTPAEAARMLACSRKRIYDLKSRGELGWTRDGRRLLIRRNSLIDYLND